MEERDTHGAGICGACGLCCDGSIFSHAPLTGEEEPVARRLSLRVFDENGQLGIRLPCPAHRGDHCSVYAERPSVCADFRCMLLGRYEAGEVGRDEALARIVEARRLVTDLRKRMAENDSAPGADLWSAFEERVQADGGAPDTIEWRRAHQALLFEAAAWHAFVLRHFRAGDQKPSD